MKKIILCLICFMLIVNCNKKGETYIHNSINLTSNFSLNADGWIGGFADYPKGQESFYELEFSYSNLPSPLDQNQRAIKMSGNNHSDDLYMFIKKKITGLIPNKKYTVSFEIEFATNAAKNSIGVGGSPAHSVYIQAGITKQEPIAIIDINDNSFYRMNINKSNQAQEGTDTKNLGDFSNGTSESKYVLKTLTYKKNELNATADLNGTLWVIVGTDSGFESTTTIYYNKINIKLN